MLAQFLYIDPLKQGLKHNILDEAIVYYNYVFIHRSIKTRIETCFSFYMGHGLVRVFIHRSIKTRIET